MTTLIQFNRDAIIVHQYSSGYTSKHWQGHITWVQQCKRIIDLDECGKKGKGNSKAWIN